MSEFTTATPDDGDPVTVYGGTSGNVSSDDAVIGCNQYWPDTGPHRWQEPNQPWTIPPNDPSTGTTTTTFSLAVKCVACESDEHSDLRSCPEVAAIEYFDSGKIKRIEFNR